MGAAAAAAAVVAATVCGYGFARYCTSDYKSQPRSDDRRVAQPRKAAAGWTIRKEQAPAESAITAAAVSLIDVLSEDLLLHVLEAYARVSPDRAVVCLLRAGGVCRLWRRVSGMRCFWQHLCFHHYRIPTGTAQPLRRPVEPRANGYVPGDSYSTVGRRNRCAPSTNSITEHYRALGVSQNASADEIKAAWNQAKMRAQLVGIAAAVRTSTEYTVPVAESSPTSDEWRRAWLSWRAEARDVIGPSPVFRTGIHVGHDVTGQRTTSMGARLADQFNPWAPIDANMWCRCVTIWSKIRAFYSCPQKTPTTASVRHPKVAQSLLPPADAVSWFNFVTTLQLVRASAAYAQAIASRRVWAKIYTLPLCRRPTPQL